jgi:hypothetical protein
MFHRSPSREDVRNIFSSQKSVIDKRAFTLGKNRPLTPRTHRFAQLITALRLACRRRGSNFHVTGTPEEKL